MSKKKPKRNPRNYRRFRNPLAARSR